MVSFFIRYTPFLVLALWTETEKDAAMGEDLVPCFYAHLLADFSQADKLGVHDFFAPHTDHMRIRFNAIVAVAPIGKPHLENPIQILEQ
jgi:hypothetical protein